MARFQKRKLSKKEASAIKKQEGQVSRFSDTQTTVKAPKKVKKQIEVPAVVSVKDLSDIMALPVTSIISALMKNGVLANINENIDFLTAQIIGDDLGFEIVEKKEEKTNIAQQKIEVTGKKLTTRPPVVAIMGHVDHGKTSLLDKIRRANVVAGESGGITQHISAFQVEVTLKKNEKRQITFIDTPGHAAFTTMRSHGTAITDMVVLIVAADDGVMPQTVEVIEQAKSNNVPIIVAVNKVDKPGADINKVKQQLVEHGLTSEEWGGETIVVEVSAKTGQGIDKLLESIALFADLKNYQADETEQATGVVIESHMHKGSGPLAILLVENGTLRKGQSVVVGKYWGKVRILTDTLDRPIAEAKPSTSVRMAGLNGLPTFGDRLLVVKSEKEAKDQAEKYREQAASDFVSAKKIVSSESEGNVKVYEFNLVVKADVKGSLEAIKQTLNAISHPELKLQIVHEGIGAVSESDVNMASTSKALLLAFRVSVMGAAKRLAELEKVMIKSYDVIYDLIDDVKARMSEILPPERRIVETGKLKVLATFRFDRKITIFGGMIESGELKRNDLIKIMRGEKEVYSGKIETLRSGKDEVVEAKSGSETGVSVAGMIDVLKDDELIAYRIDEIKRTVE